LLFQSDAIVEQMKPLHPILTKPLELIIDEWTPCLIHSESGEIYPTIVRDLQIRDLGKIGPKYGWNHFDWGIYYNNPDFPSCRIKKLMISGLDEIQGLIAYEPKSGYIEVYLAESAPWNVKGKEFSGVGPHLFAVACKESLDFGFEGYVTFKAKTDLIGHYKKRLGAGLLNPLERQMVIEPEAAKKLVSTYF
jgi:hypothetical protein